MPKRILIIDDDLELVELLKEYLSAEGFSIDAVNDGEAGVTAGLSGAYGLIILDVMLPRLGGFDVLRRLREQSRVPVLMLTARGDDVDRIVGLEMGADDYLPKPFNPRELVARIRAIQRRSEMTPPPILPPAPSEILTVGELQIDPGSRAVRLSGEIIELTSVEFSLLEFLLRHAGQVVSREEILSQVLGRSQSLYDRSVDVHVSSLRRKLGSEDGGERIKTIRGSGYQYLLPAERGEGR